MVSSLLGAPPLNFTKKILTTPTILSIETTLPLNEKQIKTFPLEPSQETKLFRRIIDIEAQVPSSLKEKLTLFFTTGIKVGQFTTNTMRIVLYSTSPIPLPKISILAQSVSFSWDKDEKKSDIFTITPPSSLPPIRPTVSLTQETPIKSKVIVLDPGHGGKDAGAIGYNSITEKHVVLHVAQKLAHLLENQGYDVIMTRNDDTFIELTERTALANRKNADLFISIHANAVASHNTEVKGIETYFLSPARTERAKKAAMKENAMDVAVMDSTFQSLFLTVLNKEKIIASNKLGIDIQKMLLSKLKNQYSHIVDNGVREAPFWVLVGATMPAVLIELGYITNPMEAERLANNDYQNSLAQGIFLGIERYFEKN